MVFDVPAEHGGALSILKEYYERAVKDEGTEWIFVLSNPQFETKENIEILNFPWVKKSWFHRLYFDYMIAPSLVKKYKADEVLSLQNILIPRVKTKQTVYLHQSLPFAEKRYKMGENLKFWLYQNVIGRLIYRSIKKADQVIVQTHWIKEAAIKKTGTTEEKFVIEPPKFNLKVQQPNTALNSKNPLFFYPAGGSEYKNHRVIIEACKWLSKRNIHNYKIVLTLDGNENKGIQQLYNISHKYNYPVEFVGKLTLEDVYDYYLKSILLFPSYLETFGLPLLEARKHNSPIIASNYPFSLEVLTGYSKAKFFDPFDSEELAQKMAKMIEK